MRQSTVARSLIALSLAVLALPASAAGQPAATARVDEYRVKAAILYNLAKFVDFPADVFTDATSPFVICVLGADPFGAALDDTVRGRQVGARPIAVRRIVDVTTGCHVMFVASSERNRVPAVVDRLRSASVLTVADADGLVEQGLIVGLRMQGDQVRLDINLATVERTKLRVSARLLALASIIRPRGDER